MNSQQAVHSKASANGFRRRVEKEVALRPENKCQAGKSNQNRSPYTVFGGKDGSFGSHSHDRLVYLVTYLTGQVVEVQLKNGSIYSGICHTANIEKEFAVVLNMARLSKDVSSKLQKVHYANSALSKKFIIPGNEIVQVTAKDVPLTTDGKSDELQHAKQHELMIDSSIAQSRHIDLGRELQPWVPDDGYLPCPELENTFDESWNRHWDQFETNEMLFGVKSTFNEELYTTKLERGPRMRELEEEATRIAREIECEETQDLHLAEERGVHLHKSLDIDEETKFSSVYRGRVVDDSGYEEEEDMLMDSRNIDTFGDAPTSTVKALDLGHIKSNDGSQVSLDSSLDEQHQSRQSLDLYLSGSNNHAMQLASELQSKSSSTLGSDIRTKENMQSEHGANDSVQEYLEEPLLPDKDSQLPKHEDSHLSSNGEEDGLDQGAVLKKFTSSSQAASGSCEKTNAISEVPVNSPSLSSLEGSAASNMSVSESVPVASASRVPSLSRNSSVGSRSSEKSTLNPYAKEFKLNPNAKSFTPSQPLVRPPSPVSDSSFYYPATSSVPHIHGMPGVGIGPSFPGHQAVIYNPQVAPMQPPQGYFHPGGPQYGQQMLFGPPRPVMYMPIPNCQPEMQFKGREY